MKTHEPQSTAHSHSVRRSQHQGPRPVLLAISGDDADAGARDAAVDVARRLGAPIHVLSVWNPTTGPGSLSAPVRVSAARATLEYYVRELAAGGATIPAAHLQRGTFPAEQILALAARVGGGLIVTGAHGGGAVLRLLHDSVSASVVRGSARPVLVVPSGGQAWPPWRVVIGDDCSAASDAVVAAGVEFASLLNLPVRLVATRTATLRTLPAAVIARHARVLTEAAGASADMLMPEGDVLKQILRASGEHALVVVGQRWPRPHDVGVGIERLSARLLHEHRGPCLIVPSRTLHAN
jgi:nucleotide-binding universal stress UspA family protein